MRRSIRSQVTPSGVLSLVAIFVALGGSAYAVHRVSGKDVVNSSLTGADIRNGSLRSGDVRNRTLRLRDLKLVTRRRLRGRRGPRGLRGQAGPQGPAGPAGPPGAAGAPAENLFAIVEVNGMLVNASPGVGPGRRGSTGSYTIGFQKDISRCAVVVTVGRTAASGIGPFENGYAGLTNFGHQVTVGLTDSEGDAVDAPFSLVVSC